MRSIVLIMATTWLIGCSHATYFLAFDDIQPSAEQTKYDAPTQIVTATDDNLSVSIGPIENTMLDLVIANRSLQAVSIIWDQCALINDNGVSQRIMHRGIKFLDKEKAMIPTTIPPGSIHMDSIISSEKIKWGKKGWVPLQPFLGVPYRGFFKEKLVKNNQKVIGTKFKFYLTYTIDGKVVGRTYSLKVADVIVD